MQIYYFSGTGNSCFIAKELKKKFNAKITKITKELVKSNVTVEDDVIGIVGPVYYSAFPLLMVDFLKKLNTENAYVFVIATYEGKLRNALAQAKSILKNKMTYGAGIQMPGDGPRAVELVFEIIKNDISIKKSIDIQPSETPEAAYKYDMSEITQRLRDADVAFSVTDKCTLCGECVKLCPADNIHLADNITFLHKCEGCQACITYCPEKAINTEKRERVGHPKIQLEDMK